MSERVYEPMEDAGDGTFVWWKEGAGPGDMPPALFDALRGGVLNADGRIGMALSYPTRAAAMAALAEARAKVGGRHPQADQLHDGNGYTVTGVPGGTTWEFSTPSGERFIEPTSELHRRVVSLLIERDEAQAVARPDVNAELLAACEEMVRAWDAFEFDEHSVPRWDSMNRFRQARDSADAAIAGAKKGTP